MVDAINEGNGRTIWPNHLAGFLAHCERSPWIGVILSVRSSYEVIITEEIRERAAVIRHDGFADRAYDAAKTFFLHYGLELPSAPLLVPEFHNPLFLKTLCKGLQASGEHRMPRGAQGISRVFTLYLDAINKHLSSILDFDRQESLVWKALKEFAAALSAAKQRWLSVEDGKRIIDAFLPDRSCNKSLYHALISEGILMTDMGVYGLPVSEIVMISYERLADHLVGQSLLERNIDQKNPEPAFASSEGLNSFLTACFDPR